MSESEEQKIQGFDWRTTIRDPKTGKVLKEQHYKYHKSAAHGEFLERDGKFYHPGSNTEEIPDPRVPQAKEESDPVKAEKKVDISFTKKV